MIDQVMVSIYTQTNGHSVLKFGSYDHEAMLGYSDISIFPTIDKNSWAIRTSWMGVMSNEINGQEEVYNSDHQFLIDPQIPFIYLPSNIYNDFKKAAQRAHPNIQCTRGTGDDSHCFMK